MSAIPPIEKRLASLLQRNKEYASTYTPMISIAGIRKKAATAPGGSIMALSCSDPRLDPVHFLKLAPSEMAIIRNAGGRASEAIRSLAVLDSIAKIGTLIIVHHTDCGQTLVLDDEVRGNIIARHPEMKNEVEGMDFGEIREGELEKTLRNDIKVIKESPLLRDEINVLALKLDLATGLLTEVKP